VCNLCYNIEKDGQQLTHDKEVAVRIHKAKVKAYKTMRSKLGEQCNRSRRTRARIQLHSEPPSSENSSERSVLQTFTFYFREISPLCFHSLKGKLKRELIAYVLFFGMY